MKNPWSDRNNFVKEHIPSNVSIVDFGCGNKEILDFCKPKTYLGIDILEDADLKINLNNEFELPDIYDLGLLLGVLEYLEDPNFTLNIVKKYTKKIIVLCLIVKKKKNWNHSFTEIEMTNLMEKHFINIKNYRYGSYMLSTGDCL